MKKHSLILPKCDNQGKRTDVALDLLKRIVGDASKKFGGCSVLVFTENCEVNFV